MHNDSLRLKIQKNHEIKSRNQQKGTPSRTEERKLIKISFYRNFVARPLISGFKAPGSAVVLLLFFIQNVSTEDEAANMTLQGAHFRQEATPM